MDEQQHIPKLTHSPHKCAKRETQTCLARITILYHVLAVRLVDQSRQQVSVCKRSVSYKSMGTNMCGSHGSRRIMDSTDLQRSQSRIIPNSQRKATVHRFLLLFNMTRLRCAKKMLLFQGPQDVLVAVRDF